MKLLVKISSDEQLTVFNGLNIIIKVFNNGHNTCTNNDSDNKCTNLNK